MYSQAIVQERIEFQEIELGFRLEYHSTEEVDAFISRFREWEKRDDAGNVIFTRGVTQQEQRFILNERALCACDAAYFLTRYAYLSDETNTRVRYKFRDTQKIYFSVISDLEEQLKSIELIIGKGRQQFVTTLTELLDGHRIFFHRDVNCFTASADRDKSAEMMKKVLFCYDNLPWWLKPKATRRVENIPGMLEFDSINSRMTVLHGSGTARTKGAQKTGIARGTTPTIYHLCLSGKTLVRVDNTGLLPISEIVGGQSTISIDGDLTCIKAISKSSRSNEMTSEIAVWGTPTPISCTRDHKVLTEEGWKIASRVTAKDALIYPIREITEDISHIEWDWYEKFKQKVSGVHQTKCSFALGRLVGMYLAEGSILRSRSNLSGVIYTIHQKEIEEVQEWIEEIFPSDGRRPTRRRNSKTGQVYIGDRGFATWMIQDFGESDSKRLSDSIWRMGKDFCRGLVFGYLYGDGHNATRDNVVYASSIRVSIPIGIRELIASLGFGWSQIAYREAGFYYNRNCKSIWILTVCGSTAIRLREDLGWISYKSKSDFSEREHWHWGPNKTIAISVVSNGDGFSSDFYDLEVSHKSHTFLTACGIVHNSEVSAFPNPEQQIQAAIFRSVHASPKVFGVLESTFAGDTGWFPSQYKFAKGQLQTGGVSRLYPLFFSWPCNRDLYPTKTWIRSNSIPEDWSPTGKISEQIIKAELFLRHSPLLSKYFGRDWRMPIEQQWYYDCQYLEHERTGALSTLLQEMPCDDVEAMQSSYDNVFGREVIHLCHRNRDKQFDTYGIVGTGIDSQFDPDPDDIDYKKNRTHLIHTPPRDNTRYEWELIPLKDNIFEDLNNSEPDDYDLVRKFAPLADGKLFVFPQAMKQDTFETSLGIDTSNGISADSSCISGSTKGNGLVPDIQLVSFRSEYVNHVQAYAFAMPIALFMKRLNNNPNDIHRWPFCGIEQIAAVGDTCQVQMRRMGYPTGRFFRFGRYDGVELNKKSSQKVGWYTVRWSRDLLIGYIVHAIKNGWYVPNSPWLIDECRTFEIHYTTTGKEKMEHSSVAHDDEIFASAISTFINHDIDTLADRGNKKLMPKNAEDIPDIEMGGSSGRTLNPDNYKSSQNITLDQILFDGASLERFRY